MKAQAPEHHGTKPSETGFREHCQPCALDKAALLAFGLYLIGLLGARGLVGNPFFPYRGFRHRCIYVRRDSKLNTGTELGDTRVCLNSWKTKRIIWPRVALRDEGVRLERVD